MKRHLLLAVGLAMAAGRVVGAGAQEKAAQADTLNRIIRYQAQGSLSTPENWAIAKVSVGQVPAVGGAR